MDLKGMQAYTDDLILALKKRKMNYEVLDYGISVKNGLDTWLIEIMASSGHNKAMVKLYHKNLFHNKGRWKKEHGHGDMHIQFTKSCTVNYVVNYILQHGEKYSM